MKILCIDPGEDTGWAVFQDGQLIEAGTEKLWTFIEILGHAFERNYPSIGSDRPAYADHGIDGIVCEDWALYPWKSKEMAFDPCRTARGIGAITYLSRRYGKEFTLQPAKIKERAEAAGAENFFSHPLKEENRHANDAIRHGVYYYAVRRHGIKQIQATEAGPVHKTNPSEFAEKMEMIHG